MAKFMAVYKYKIKLNVGREFYFWSDKSPATPPVPDKLSNNFLKWIKFGSEYVVYYNPTEVSYILYTGVKEKKLLDTNDGI